MSNKIKENIVKNKWIYITFALSSIVISTIFILQKIAPFGNNSMLDVDFYHQYGPLLNELYDRVKSGSSLLYSFNTGGGIPFYRNFLNYLSSPFNIFLFLFKKDNIVMAFSIIIALKVIFASTTMSFFLKKTFKKDNILLCVFGLLYAYSGYFCAYYWNIMWLDGIVFLPLIAYGINKIVDDKRPLTYILILALMLFANYFISYMICIFSVLYFLGYFLCKKGFKIKEFMISGLYFLISSFLAAGLVSFALIPLYKSLASISATTDSFPHPKVSFDLIDFLFNHITGVSRTVFASDKLPLPNIYCGLISIISVILLFLNRNIKLKFKIVSVIFFIVFIMSFSITSFDFIWHAFHVPNDLPWRYSFIYVFGFISISYYSLTKLKSINPLITFITISSVIVFILLSLELEFANTTEENTLMCLLFVLVYGLIYLLYKYNVLKKQILYASLLFVVMGECVYGINGNWNINHDINTFMSSKKAYQNLISKAKKDDNGLYRLEKTSYLTLNDGAWYNYYGISTFSSMAYESTAKTQRKLGMAGNNINSYYYQNYQTPIYNTMFNVKYIMGNYIENDYYTPIDTIESYSLTGYNYSSSIAYLVNKDIKKWNLIDYDPFLNQENFLKLSSNIENVFEPVQVKSISGGKIVSSLFIQDSNGDFYYELDKPGTKLTLMINNPKYQNIYFYIGGNNVSGFNINDKYYSLTSDEYYIFDAGKISEGDFELDINFKDDNSGNLKFYAYSLNDTKFKEFYEYINSGKLNVKKYSDTYIEGKINASDDKTVFSTISYDKGWKVLVDEKKVQTYNINSFLAFDLKKGKHTIKLIYYPDGMKIGVIISFLSILIVAFYTIFTRKKA